MLMFIVHMNIDCQVILSACSNTFKTILKETQAPHPVIVLWDIEARDVSALLDFMYNGQVRSRMYSEPNITD